nr:MAG TPA: hypothetical protein [Caudoviricetes sp.]
MLQLTSGARNLCCPKPDLRTASTLWLGLIQPEQSFSLSSLLLQTRNVIQEVKMYRPTMNLNRAFKEGGEVIEAYTLEGQKEGRKRFEARLKREGYASVEDWEKALRTEPHLDLLFYAMSLEDELAGWKRQAFDPNISPEESFDCMADAFHIIEGIRVIDKIVGGHERLMLRYNPSEEM